jgi:hypothetical protein
MVVITACSGGSSGSTASTAGSTGSSQPSSVASYSVASASISGTECAGMVGNAAPAAPSTPALPGEDIVFGSLGGTKVVRPDGSGLRDFGPLLGGITSWTADRSRAVGYTGTGLSLFDAASGTVTPIPGTTDSDVASSISPDGRSVAIERNNRELIVALVADGHVQDKVGLSTLNPMVPPRWSPNGESLLVVIDGSVGLIDVAHLDHVMTLSPNVTSASWSPDGTMIAATVAERNGPDGLYVLDTHTGTATPLSTPRAGAGSVLPTWSPDGKRIAFVVSPRGDYFDTKALCVVDLASGAVVMVGQDATTTTSPAWSADSSWLAYDTEAIPTGDRKLHVTAASGGADNVLDLPGTVIAGGPIWVSPR